MISFSNAALTLKKKTVLEGVNFTVDSGELVYIAGKSGSGKTTLLKAIYMQVLPSKGEVTVGGYSSKTIKKRHIPHLRRKLGIVFQDFRLLEDRSVYDNLAFVLKVTNTKNALIRKRVEEALQEVGLTEAAGEMPLDLSGGEQQRVAIARALVREPIAILADEPTGNLDPETSLEIMQYLKKINSKGITVIVATHDYELVRHHPSRSFLIAGNTLQPTTFSNSAAGYRPHQQA
ncbi:MULTISPECIES: cell division ATP-binding protein FtsE [Prosthecochloris]|uniref:Cell division ATP-binding protein FtsE n=1 Tax=Prosthecochloris vibrioformis TaxID=1098 RepID=A0A5C4RZU8_PROVB|nr:MULTISPECIES: ATP-binding cassette domain-containing protein [Prosthecochloris]ANT65357.1 Cell division ATP-binding protein FtsE [Prosthecochloris sp. CIB 2401]TNJ36231.1 ATP-binding cassette domain-containing protein [Prosthecochloris vibrioformis]